MTAPRLTYIPDIVEEHFEELQFLWGLRARAARSPSYTLRELGMLEERIEARVQGLFAVGDRVLPLLDAGLAGEDAGAVFIAAFALLRTGTEPAARRVVDAFARAEGRRLDALCDAMCTVHAPALVEPVDGFLRSADMPRAAAAAHVLALQAEFRPHPSHLEQFLREHKPAVRESGWRLVARIGVQVPAEWFGAAMCDDPPVRRAAIDAAAWTGQPGLLVAARHAADVGAVDQVDLLHMLAILGGPEDAARVATLTRCADLGPERFRIATAFGHPALVPDLLAAMDDPDPATAAAAGDAFHTMTGHDVSSSRTAAVADPTDEFEAAFVDQVRLPDAARAREVWARIGPERSPAGRLRRGIDLDGPLDAAAFVRLDLEARYELFLRARYRGLWHGSPSQLAVFPQTATTANA